MSRAFFTPLDHLADTLVYQSATIDPPLALGCYTDSSDSRTLTGSARNDGKLTIDSCINSCRSTGYMYAGLEYGTQVSQVNCSPQYPAKS
jgi:hypothetical protein